MDILDEVQNKTVIRLKGGEGNCLANLKLIQEATMGYIEV